MDKSRGQDRGEPGQPALCTRHSAAASRRRRGALQASSTAGQGPWSRRLRYILELISLPWVASTWTATPLPKAPHCLPRRPSLAVHSKIISKQCRQQSGEGVPRHPRRPRPRAYLAARTHPRPPASNPGSARAARLDRSISSPSADARLSAHQSWTDTVCEDAERSDLTRPLGMLAW